jgi:hypothetical protein
LSHPAGERPQITHLSPHSSYTACLNSSVIGRSPHSMVMVDGAAVWWTGDCLPRSVLFVSVAYLLATVRLLVVPTQSSGETPVLWVSLRRLRAWLGSCLESSLREATLGACCSSRVPLTPLEGYKLICGTNPHRRGWSGWQRHKSTSVTRSRPVCRQIHPVQTSSIRHQSPSWCGTNRSRRRVWVGSVNLITCSEQSGVVIGLVVAGALVGRVSVRLPDDERGCAVGAG